MRLSLRQRKKRTQLRILRAPRLWFPTCPVVLSNQPPYLDRSVYCNELSAESVDELQSLARDAATGALRAVNRRAHELVEQDKGRENAHYRINFGTYFYTNAKVKAGELEDAA